MDIQSLGPILELLLIACLVGMAARWLRQSYTIALVLVGLAIAFFKLTPSIALSKDAIFFLILPPLLFQGAMHMDVHALKANWKTIFLLAVPGIVVTMLCVGALIHWLWHLPWVYAFLFGSIVAATDPISVLAMMKTAGAPKRLQLILEAESIFNDGTGVVLFSVIWGLIAAAGGQIHAGAALLQFIQVVALGAIVGAACGYMVYRLMKYLNDHLLEVTMTIVLTFGTPLIAEFFHGSGIIAIVTAGLMVGNFGRAGSMSTKTRETVENFWEVMDFIVNSLIFLCIGIELQVITPQDLKIDWQPVLIGIAAVIGSRALVVYPSLWITNLIDRHKITLSWAHILFWGGLRGAIPLALVLGLPEFQYRHLFLAATFGVVIATLVLQGLTMRPLIRRLL